MARDPNRKPDYLPWDEDAFVSSIHTRMMNDVQRWMYRALLQSMFSNKERPYLPTDDRVLQFLAGCSDKKLWDENKSLVLCQFKQIVIHGVQLLENHRVTSDWATLAEKRDRMAELSQRGVDARSTHGDRTVTERSQNGDQGKVREGKVREGKGREGEEPPTADRPSSEPLQGSASIAEGQPGYYAEGQYGFLNTPKKVCDRMGQVWRELVGKAALTRKPFGKGWDWFSEFVGDNDVDVLIPAFEIWATERGKFNAARIDSPVMEFLKDDPGGWMKRVLPLNTFDGGKYVEPVISEELAAQQLAEHKQRWGLSLPQLEEELQNEEAALGMLGGGFTPEERERTEKHIASLKEQIGQEKAYLAGRK